MLSVHRFPFGTRFLLLWSVAVRFQHKLKRTRLCVRQCRLEITVPLKASVQVCTIGSSTASVFEMALRLSSGIALFGAVRKRWPSSTLRVHRGKRTCRPVSVRTTTCNSFAEPSCGATRRSKKWTMRRPTTNSGMEWCPIPLTCGSHQGPELLRFVLGIRQHRGFQ